MTVTFDLPRDIEESLRRTFQDLESATKEAALVELYRQEKITQNELARALGVSRMESEAVLKAHHVYDDFPTDIELGRARDRLGEIGFK